MRVERRDPPREFQVGPVTISHCADVELEPDEQITLVSGSGTESTSSASPGATTRRRRPTAGWPSTACGPR